MSEQSVTFNSAPVYREEYWAGENSRRIVRRVVIEGDLVLQTPAHLGNGEDDGLEDMILLTDPCDGKTPLLTGASLAGALRNHLRERQWGYGRVAPKGTTDLGYALFGDEKGRDDPNDPNAPKARQSTLIVDDAFGCEASFGIERRDGVRIDEASRTACDNAKYDAQFWEAGTTFPLRLEWLIGEDEVDAAATGGALRAALVGLHDDLGGIRLGARKRRGFGAAQAQNWKTRDYNLATREGLRGWLLEGEEDVVTQGGLDVLGEELEDDAREYFNVRLTLRPESSLLVRDEGEVTDAPDSVHLRSKRVGANEPQPVLPGTSAAGVLCARAGKIARTLYQARGANEQDVAELVNEVFGTMEGEVVRASRFECQERVLEGMNCDLVQSRVSIDYFTGGARQARLFNEQPAVATPDSRAELVWRLRNPGDKEIGLLLQVVKDVWTGDVAFGGEQSVGRGRFAGVRAELTHRARAQDKYSCQQWMLNDDGTHDGDLSQLEFYALELMEAAKGAK